MRSPWSIIASMAWSLGVASLKARYRKTIAGFFWVITGPIIAFLVQCFVFRSILHIQMENEFLFLAGGLFPWMFLTQTLAMGTPILVTSGPFLKSYTVHPMVVFLAQSLDNVLNFVVAFMIAAIAIAVFQPPNWSGLGWLPLCFLILCLGGMTMAWGTAILHVFFRDTNFIVQFVTSTLFFLTPIFYPPEYIPPMFRRFIDLNPMYAFIAPFRMCFSGYDMVQFERALGIACLHLGIIGVGVYILWRKKKNEFYLYI